MTQTAMRVPLSQLPFDWRKDGELRRQVIAALDAECDSNRWTLGPHVQTFEERFAEYIGVRHAIGVGSGTDALFLIMKALGIGEGDRVVTVPTTFPATANAIIHTEATPVFVDIGDDYNINLEIAAVHTQTATLPVAWGGLPVKPFREHAGFRVPIQIEDAAQAAGATRFPGYAASAFSLHPLKTLHVMGDGGVVTTNDDALADEIRLLRNHGLQDRDTCVRNGYNMRLHSIQAIVANHVLDYLDEWNEARIANARRYYEGLCDVAGVVLPPRDENVKHIYHLYQFEVRGNWYRDAASLRNILLGYLQERGIEAAAHYPQPLHLQPAFTHLGYSRGDFPRAERFADTHITLPVHQHLTMEQVDYTIDTVRRFFGAH